MSLLDEVTHRTVDLGEVRLHYVEEGHGPLVVLLHGFPEFWYSWRHQIPALAHAGFRVVAVDQRGYGGSDKPRRWQDYRIETLAGDIAALIAALGEERAHVVGHDWGAAVAWMTATLHPERVDRLAALNVPHPARMFEGLRTPQQLAKSWYMFFFQLPWLPETLFTRGGRRALQGAYRDARPGAFTDEDLDRYADALLAPGAMKAAIDWYRAALRRDPRRTTGQMGPIEAETLVIWGERDRFLGAELAEPPAKLVPHARVVRLPDASHWVQHDAPEEVNRLLVEHLRGGAAA
ncbi:MAG TPA: alpha/beta hydrolase [Baekduia sp.]|nr:alpha/beta hydrolase [Baekduia sp.]